MTGVLSALARRLYFGARMALQGPLAPQDDASGPLPPECCEPASAPPMSGLAAPSHVSGSRASAEQWCAALAGAGSQLSDEGFEDQAVMCFVAAGELDAIAHGDMAT